MSLLEVRDLHAGYGRIEIVSGVSASVSDREILAIVGPNGSGKSTLLKAIFGLCKVFTGNVFFKGVDVTRIPPYRRSLNGLVYLPQTRNVFESLTGRENLELAVRDVHESDFRKRFEGIITFLPEVKGLLNRKVKTMSGGERQMIALAMCLMRTPSLIMLDEPTAALAPNLARHVLERVSELRDEMGLAVVLVEQNALTALEVSDKALLMVSGSTRFYGKPQELLEDRELVKTYLGV
ncbi:MAG: ABC transporter ATP-binding protein [Thermofilaceae archaeon]|nr:ABC transporter ATP-binding protein [Thermofilaceae archaeon]MDW8003916.1 ABC transporter ATP-binding protein [Thermofilaceae archaeon]